jgi:hypothetical protein
MCVVSGRSTTRPVRASTRLSPINLEHARPAPEQHWHVCVSGAVHQSGGDVLPAYDGAAHDHDVFLVGGFLRLPQGRLMPSVTSDTRCSPGTRGTPWVTMNTGPVRRRSAHRCSTTAVSGRRSRDPRSPPTVAHLRSAYSWSRGSELNPHLQPLVPPRRRLRSVRCGHESVNDMLVWKIRPSVPPVQSAFRSRNLAQRR